MLGAGTGRGEDFAHPDCFWKDTAKYEKERADALQKRLDEVMDTICIDCYQHIEGVNLKEELQ
jgi:hypothetical protein